MNWLTQAAQDPGFIYTLVVIAVVVIGLTIMIRQMRQYKSDTDYLGRAIASVLRTQNELTGRFDQLATDAQARQAALMQSVNERLDGVSKRLGDTLQKTSNKTAETLGELRKHLNVIDEAQKNIAELSGQVVGLQDILSNKQARGAFGEMQLRDLVRNALPPSAYSFETTLANGRRVDCLVKLPMPPGPIAIDAKFPLESFEALRAATDDHQRNQATAGFRRDILKHVKDIAERYIVPDETAESALMFLPSEAIYAELHANFPDLVQESYRARVWIVSPTTLMATLNTVRAVLQDANMREQAAVIQSEVRKMLDDFGRLGERVGRLQRHFRQAGEDVDQIVISTDKISRRGHQIVDIGLGESLTSETIDADQPELEIPFKENQ